MLVDESLIHDVALHHFLGTKDQWMKALVFIGLFIAIMVMIFRKAEV